MVLPLLGPVVEVPKTMVPLGVPTPPIEDPRMVQLVTRLFCAPFAKNKVLVLVVGEAVVLVKVRELPPLFRPLMVTLSAPLKEMRAKPGLIAAEMVRAPTGVMRIEV